MDTSDLHCGTVTEGHPFVAAIAWPSRSTDASQPARSQWASEACPAPSGFWHLTLLLAECEGCAGVHA